jgi:P-type E1-E2 ATPase
MNINIPGWGNIDVENVILDLNGTLATDGKIPPDVKEKIKLLSQKVKVYVLTADTQGTALEECQKMGVECTKVPEEGSSQGKIDFLRTLGPEGTVAIGNGDNDQLVLKEAALGVAVLGDEGLSVSALVNADVMAKNISDALNLLLKPKRLMATLRT